MVRSGPDNLSTLGWRDLVISSNRGFAVTAFAAAAYVAMPHMMLR